MRTLTTGFQNMKERQKKGMQDNNSQGPFFFFYCQKGTAARCPNSFGALFSSKTEAVNAFCEILSKMLVSLMKNIY